MGAAYSGIHMYQIMRVPLLPRPLLVQLLLFVVVVVSYIQRIGCQPEKNYFKQYFGEIKHVLCFKERGPKFYVLNHLADLTRRRLRRRLISIQPRKIKNKSYTMFQSRVTVV